MSAIHEAVKRRILELKPYYQYPRRHSFNTWIEHLISLGLLERTGRKEEPEGRGAGKVGTAGGFRERSWVRLVLSSRESPVWQDPMKAIQEKYGIVRPVTPPVERRREEEVAPRHKPPRQRQGTVRTRTKEKPPAPAPSVEMEELRAQLDERREGLRSIARIAASQGRSVEIFESLLRSVTEFVNLVEPHYKVFPIEEIAIKRRGEIQPGNSLATLVSCIRTHRAAPGSTARDRALASCRQSAAIIAADLTTPLRTPEV